MTEKSNSNDNKNDRSIIINRYEENIPAIFHSQLCFEIIYIFDGRCVQNIGLHCLNLQKGDIIILSPNIIHSIEMFDNESIIFDILIKYDNFYETFAPLLHGDHVINKFFSESLHAKNPIKYLIFHTGTDNFLTNNVTQMFNDQMNRDDYTDLFLVGNLLIGFVYLMRNYSHSIEFSTSNRSNLPDEFFIMSYIQDHLATVSLTDVAKHFNFSLSHCSRLIKSATGHNFNEWKRILRIRKAQYLLRNTNYTVTEIANSLGYMNLENFIRAFQEELKMTPTQYRHNNK